MIYHQAANTFKPTSNQDLIMKKTISLLFVFLAFVFAFTQPFSGNNVRLFRRVTITISDSYTESGVTYNASASVQYTKSSVQVFPVNPSFGFISSVGTNTISFESSTDADGNVFNPFVTGAFKSTSRFPF